MAEHIDLTNAETAIQQIIAATADGGNPWETISAALRSQVEWDLGLWFRVQLYVLSGLLAIAPVTLFASLFVRWRQGNLWLFRAMRGQGGTYIVPHYLTTWAVFTAIFLCVLQGFIWEAIAKSNKEVVKTITLWEMLTWLPAYIGFWLATCSLITTHILHLDSSGRYRKSFFTSAWVVNTATFLVPAAAVGSLIPMAIQAQHKYETASKLYVPLETILQGAIKSYNGTLNTDLLASGIGTGQEFLSDINIFVKFFNSTFYLWTGWVVLLMVSFATASALHLGELSKTMDELQNRSHASDEVHAQEQVIYETYNSLVKITIAIFATFAAFAGMLLFVAASGRKVIVNMDYLATAHLMPSYTFTILGVPLSIMLFRRALLNPDANAGNSNRSKTGGGGGDREAARPRRSSLKTPSVLEPATESHEMHRVTYGGSPEPNSKDHEFTSNSSEAEYPMIPPTMPKVSAYAGSPTSSSAPFAGYGAPPPHPPSHHPAQPVPMYTPTGMAYQARAPSMSSSSGWGDTRSRQMQSSSPGPNGLGGQQQQQRGGGRGLVPAAEPMGEAVPSFYAARSTFS